MAWTKTILCQCPFEGLGEGNLQGLLLIVIKAFAGLAVHALLGVEFIGGLIPDVAQVVDVEGCLPLIILDDQSPCVGGVANLRKAHADVFKILAEFKLMLVTDLDDHTGILGE